MLKDTNEPGTSWRNATRDIRSYLLTSGQYLVGTMLSSSNEKSDVIHLADAQFYEMQDLERASSVRFSGLHGANEVPRDENAAKINLLKPSIVGELNVIDALRDAYLDRFPATHQSPLTQDGIHPAGYDWASQQANRGDESYAKRLTEYRERNSEINMMMEIDPDSIDERNQATEDLRKIKEQITQQVRDDLARLDREAEAQAQARSSAVDDVRQSMERLRSSEPDVRDLPETDVPKIQRTDVPKKTLSKNQLTALWEKSDIKGLIEFCREVREPERSYPFLEFQNKDEASAFLMDWFSQTREELERNFEGYSDQAFLESATQILAETKPGMGTWEIENLIVRKGTVEELLTFARDIHGAHVSYLQPAIMTHAHAHAQVVYEFARDVPGANIEECHSWLMDAGDDNILRAFARDVLGAPIDAEEDTPWRVPNIAELKALIVEIAEDVEEETTAIDDRVFPSCPPESFWSASPCGEDSGYRWFTSFGFGYEGWTYKGNDCPVRLVRDGQVFDPSWPALDSEGRWFDCGEGLAFDRTMGLQWQRYCVGQTWADGQPIGKAKRFTWDEAMALVAPPAITEDLDKAMSRSSAPNEAPKL